MRCQVLVAGLVVFVLSWTGAARGNGPEVGFAAGTIYPRDNAFIRLRSERVEIDLSREYTVDPPSPNALCEYVLENLSSGAQTFSMAFVTNPPISPDEPESWSWHLRGAQFVVHQDGREIPVQFAPGRGTEFRDGYGAEADSFPVWTLTLAPRSRSTVRMQYDASWSGGGCDGEDCSRTFHYFTRPAARWAGRIEAARFVLILGTREQVRRLQRPGQKWSVSVDPAGVRWIDRGLEWQFSDWEPDSDLRVSIDFNRSDPSRDPWSTDSLSSIPDPTTDLDGPFVTLQSECDDPREGRPLGGWPADSVHVRVHVTRDGRVDATRLPGPSSLWDEKASECVRRWRFQPPTRKGVAVDAWTDVVYRLPARP